MPIFAKYGSTEFPVEAAAVTNAQLVSALDPGGDTLRELFKAALNAELTPVWNVAVAGVSRLAGRSVVQSVFHEAPRASILKEINKEDPCLFLYRTSSTHTAKYIQYGEITTQWGLDYIVGALTVEDYRRIGSIFIGVQKVIDWVVRRAGHSAYLSGKLVFLDSDSPFSNIKVLNSQIGVADFGQDGTGFEIRALHMTIETCELESDNLTENLDVVDLEGVDYDIDLEPEDE